MKFIMMNYFEIKLSPRSKEWPYPLPDGTQIKMYPDEDEEYWSDRTIRNCPVAGSVPKDNPILWTDVRIRIPVND